MKFAERLRRQLHFAPEQHYCLIGFKFLLRVCGMAFQAEGIAFGMQPRWLLLIVAQGTGHPGWLMDKLFGSHIGMTTSTRAAGGHCRVWLRAGMDRSQRYYCKNDVDKSHFTDSDLKT